MFLQKYSDPTMMRFLIARSMDVEKAAKMFVQWQKWRETMIPNGRIDESEIEDELGARKIYLQGLSKNGHSVMIVKGNKHFPAKDQVQFKSESLYLAPVNSFLWILKFVWWILNWGFWSSLEFLCEYWNLFYIDSKMRFCFSFGVLQFHFHHVLILRFSLKMWVCFFY